MKLLRYGVGVVWLMGVVAGCTPHSQAPVLHPVVSERPGKSVPQLPIVTDPKVVDTVSTVMMGLDKQTFKAVSTAEVGGLVLLTGAVVRPDQRRLVEQKVSQVPGVSQVINQIVIADTSALEGYRPDTGKEKQMASLVPANAAVRVVQGVVHMVGYLSPEQVDQFKAAVADDPAVLWVDSSGVIW